MFDFEKLIVYKKSLAFDGLVQRIILNKRIDSIIRNQLIRASLSVVLNISEGAGKFSKNDKRKFYITSRGSIFECVGAIQILRLRNQINYSDYNQVYALSLEIANMLTGLIRK